MKKQLYTCLLLLPLFLNACTWLGLQTQNEQEATEQSDPTQLPAEAQSSSTDYNVTTSEELAKIDNGAQGEVYFTNPDNPEEDIAGITQAFENKRSGQRWLPNYMAGLRESRSEGLPCIIWFHDSTISPKSKEVGRALLNTQEFLDWTKDRAICICLDTGPATSGKDSSSSSLDYINGVQNKYKLKRKPSFAIVSASGKVIDTIDGYDGFISEISMRIKQSVAQAEQDFSDYKAEKSLQGYREWTSADGQSKLFARPTRFDEKTDTLYLRDYTGRILKIHEAKFCDPDVDYIENTLRKGGPKY